MLSLGLGLAANVLLARLLSPSEFGSYFLALSLVAIGQTFAQLGLPTAVVRVMAQSLAIGSPSRARAVVSTTVKLSCAGAVIVGLFIASPVGRKLVELASGSDALANVAVLLALLIAVVTLEYLVGEMFRGLRVISLATLCGGLLSTILTTAAFAVLQVTDGSLSLESVLLVVIAATSTATVLGFTLIGWRLPPRARGLDGVPATEMLGIAWPFLANAVMLILLRNTDIWALGSVEGPRSVAVYAAANKVVNLIAAPLVVTNAVVPPIIAGLYAKGETEKLERILRVSATVAGIPSAVMLVALVSGAGPLLDLLFGDYYSRGSTALVILALGNLYGVVAGSCGITLAMTGHQKSVLFTSIVAGLFTATSAILGAHFWGINGVAAALAGGTVLQNTLQVRLVRKLTGIRTRMSLRLTVREGRRSFLDWRDGRL